MSSGQKERTIKDLIVTPDTASTGGVLDRVMETVMRLTLTVAEATGGQLLLPEHGSFRTRARVSLQRDDVVQTGESFEDDSLVLSIAYAVVSSGQSITLNTAGEAAQMFLRYGAPVHLLWSAHCVPLHQRGRPVAVLYLENRRLENAFPKKLRSLLDQLALQIAIVIEDARDHATVRDEGNEAELPESELNQAGFELAQSSTMSIIDALLTSVTHEISQPLSAIDASSSAGLRWLQRDSPNLDEAVISLEKVRSCAVRARKIIDDLRSLKSNSKKGR
jgi:GAF domain-containing protein